MNFTQLKNHDWLITAVLLILLAIGLVTIYSTTLNSVSEAQGAGTLPKQMIFIIIGLLVYFGISTIDISWLRLRPVLAFLYLFMIASLIGVLVAGQSIAGTNRWIDIGFFSFQPSEYAKIVLILVTAAVFTSESTTLATGLNLSSRKRHSRQDLRSYLFELHSEHPVVWGLLMSIITALPLILLTLIQPSLGNAVIIAMLWLIMLVSTSPDQKRLGLFLLVQTLLLLILSQVFSIKREAYDLQLNLALSDANWFLVVFSLAGVVAGMLAAKFRPVFMVLLPLITVLVFAGFIGTWNGVITNYQKDRIDTFLSGPESDPLGTGYQVRQSKIAIGSGRLLGRGFLEGTQSSLNVLTQAHTDFVFAALSEQFGFIGSAILLLLYLVLIIRILRTGLESTSDFGRVVALGIGALILLHVFINVGMNMGRLPVTGIPLPLVSYGGNSVLVTLISLGIVQSIAGSRRAVDISDTLMVRSQSRLY